MDRLEYHKERLDRALGFKRDENFAYELEPVDNEFEQFDNKNSEKITKNQSKSTEYPLNFQTGATFDNENPFKESNAYKKYMSTREEVLEEAKTISNETGIPLNSIIVDSKTLDKAREIYDYKKKVMDFDELYKRYPALKKLDETDGAISLHNVKDVKKVTEAFEAAKVGWKTDSIQAERNALGYEKFLGNAIDEKRLEEINVELEELKELPSLFEAPLASVVGGTVQQGKMMARHIIKGLDTVALGTTMGAIGNAFFRRENTALAPAMIIGARTALPASIKAGLSIEMFKESAGGYYLEYLGYKDKFGNQLLTDSDARVYAALTAASDTAIEMANFGAIVNVLKGSKGTLKAGKIIESIVKNAKDYASVKAQLKTWIRENAKNVGVVAFTETAEEDVQEMASMGITKMARVNNPDGNIPDYSAGDILKGGVDAMEQALPAALGFGVIGAGASGMRFTRQAAQLLTIGKERADEALRTHTGIELVNKLMEAARTTKLGKEHKETFNKFMKANLEGTAHETAYVDTELLMQEEGGEIVLNQLASVAGMTEEQLNTYKETGAPIEINTADLVSTIAEQNEINLNDYVSFNAADICLARNQKVAKEIQKLTNQINTAEIDRLVENINTLTTEMFGETEEQFYASQIIAEYEDPSAGVIERRRQIHEEIDGMINPVIEQMHGGMGKGTSLHFTDDFGNIIDAQDHDSHIGGATRLSNNDSWYTRYYKENKKAPSEAELRELAEEVITGSNPYGVGDFDYTDPDMVVYAEETKARLDGLRHELELLDNIEAKLKNVDKGEFAALDALTQEGVKVYKAVADLFRNSPYKKTRNAATMNALVYAHIADRFASVKRVAGNKKYTALDFIKAHPIEFGGEAERGALGQSDMSPEGFYAITVLGNEFGEYKDIKELRKKAQSWYRKNLQGSAAYNPVLGKILIDANLEDVEFKFTGAGRKKMVDNSANPIKMFTVKHLKELTENANYITFADSDGTKHIGERFYFLHVGINTEKGRSYAIINIRRTKEGDMFYYGHNIYQDVNEYNAQIEKTVQDTSATRVSAPGPDGSTAISNSSIADEDKIFNQQQVFYQSAWHGTPHSFNSFDLGSVGSGEGAQVHGWGLYFAKDKKVAETYRERLSGNTILYKGKDLNELYDKLVNKGDYGKASVIEELMSSSLDELRKYKDDFIADEIFTAKEYNWFEKSIVPHIKMPGTLIEVDVPENNVLLDEDKPLNEQSVEVRKAILEYYKSRPDDYIVPQNIDDLGVQTGEEFYSDVTFQMQRDGHAEPQRAASELLNSLGIKGISYDGAIDGRCFVVFDDKAISIINRFNQAAGQGALTANLAALEEAMKMNSEYQDAKTIYKKTGWYLGTDGKWRFDIPDNFDKIDLSELPDAGHSIRLKDLYDNPALYKAYPWLGEAWVTVGELTEGYRGTADSANNVIELNSELVKKGDREIIGIGKDRFIRAKTDEETEEWQPLSGEVLTEIERMAIGMITANGNDIDKAMVEAQSEIDKAIESIKFNEANRPTSMMLQVAKQNLATNKSILEALEEIKQKGFAYTSFPFTDEEKTRNEIGKTLIHEIQHLIQDNEGFARGGNPTHVHRQMRRQIDAYRRKALAIDQNAQPYYNRQRDWEAAIIEGASPEKIQTLQKELSFLEELVPEEKRQSIIDLLGEADRLERQLKESLNPFYDYQNLHGEQEARAASRKAEINTKIEQLKTIEVKSLDEILAGNIEKIAPENQDAIREWVEIEKNFDKSTMEEAKKLNERQSEIEAQVKDDAGAQVFFGEYDENFEAKWNKDDIGNLERDYTEEVLEGINPYNAIVVFGGDVISGYSVGSKGQTKISTSGQKIIRLFESADESTFIHEMGHVAYENLRELASLEDAPAQIKRDLKTLDDWANWKEGQINEYVGSATYMEFKALDDEIRKTLADGGDAEQLLYKWRQERFARGWEEYFKKGKAPTVGLRKVFYQFKKWLTSIYRAFKTIGGVPTKEVEDVMKRMLLTDEAIELAEKKAELEAFEKSGVFDYLDNDNSRSMWNKILEDIRAEANAKVLKIAMKDMTETAKVERQDKIEAERKATRERMAKEPLWGIYSTLKYNPKASVGAVCQAFNMTPEEYASKLRACGGSFDRAVDAYMKTYIEELESPNRYEIEKRAEEVLATSYYVQLRSAFELELLQRKVRQEARLSKKIAGIVAESEEERAEQEKALRELDKKAEEARSQRALRDVAVGNIENIREAAKQRMAAMTIDYAANPTIWKNASRQKAAEMTAALAKKEYAKAAQAAKMRMLYDVMVDLATENKKFVDRNSKKMRDRAKTVRREKNMAADDRYVYFHLLYAFGLAERDVPVPPEYESFEKVLVSIKNNADFGLENMSISFVDGDGKLKLSDFILNAGTGEAKYAKGIASLTVSQFKELADVMDNIYTVAVDAKKIKTVTDEEGKAITVEQVVAEMQADIEARLAEPNVKDTTRAGNLTTMDKVLDARNKLHLLLIKAETLLGEMGPAFTKYIYDPIKRASDKELKMTEEFTEKIVDIKAAWRDGKVVKYMNQGMSQSDAEKAADKEMREMYSVKKYKLGTSTLTKENIIAFALNWGTEANRDRALNYQGTTKAAFERVFAELDGADWQFVMNVWDLFDETWPQLKEVEARVSGVTLEKQEGIVFNITDKEGATYIIQGKYYPIKYDPNKTARAETLQKEEGIRTKLPSMARMGVGVGMTKERAVRTNYLIRNDLGVFGEAIAENIHLICMREAVRDVSRIVNDRNFIDVVESRAGKNVAPMLQEWVLDCWQVEPKIKNQLEQVMSYVRRKQTMAVLGFRLLTALLNAANIGPMSDYLGAVRAGKAIKDFYAHQNEHYNFVMERSPFVRNRAKTMDRDMRDVLKDKGMGEKLNWIQEKAFVMLTQTDLMLACPLWLAEYQRIYQENIEKGLAPDALERMAVDAGDKAVRTVFGSGLVQDLAAVQKGGEATKMLTMYYSYFSVVYQAISRAVYERSRRLVNKEDWLRRNAPVLDLVLWWFLVPSAIAVLIKGSDDEDETAKDYLLRIGAESLNTATGTVPLVRDFSQMAITYLVDGKYYGSRATPIGENMENMMDVIRAIKGYAEDKKDVSDVARAVLRTGAYASGLPAVGADGIATIMQWFEYGDATPEEIQQYLTAIINGKKVKK